MMTTKEKTMVKVMGTAMAVKTATVSMMMLRMVLTGMVMPMTRQTPQVGVMRGQG